MWLRSRLLPGKQVQETRQEEQGVGPEGTGIEGDQVTSEILWTISDAHFPSRSTQDNAQAAPRKPGLVPLLSTPPFLPSPTTHVLMHTHAHTHRFPSRLHGDCNFSETSTGMFQTQARRVWGECDH